MSIKEVAISVHSFYTSCRPGTPFHVGPTKPEDVHPALLFPCLRYGKTYKTMLKDGEMQVRKY